MTDERKIITFEQYLWANDWWPSDEITTPGTQQHLRSRFNLLPDAPKHTDEEYTVEKEMHEHWHEVAEKSFVEIRELNARNKELDEALSWWGHSFSSRLIKQQEARIKELEEELKQVDDAIDVLDRLTKKEAKQ